MAGTPSSRSCDYCRRQKQKCDEVKPQCGRCKKLKITCVGSGEKRYLFKSQPAKYDTKHHAQLSTHLPNTKDIQLSEVDKVSHKFVDDLQVADLRYNLWVYGAFLQDIPRLIGSNKALDAAVDVFSTALPVLRTKLVSENMQAKYIKAIAALRVALSDSTIACESGTLCAIYLLTLAQHYLGIRGGQSVSHSKGVLQIIRYASIHKAKNEFQLNLLKSLCLQIIFDSLFNSSIDLDEDFFQLISSWEIRDFRVEVDNMSVPAHDALSKPIESLVLRNFARLPRVVHSPRSHIGELEGSYWVALRDLQLTRRRIETATALVKNLPQRCPLALLKCLILQQTIHGLMLGIALYLNGTLRAMDRLPLDLAKDFKHLSQDVLELATNCHQYRPLGANYMPFCLMVACAVSDDTDLAAHLQRLLEDWQADSPDANYLLGAEWLRFRLQDVRKGRE